MAGEANKMNFRVTLPGDDEKTHNQRNTARPMITLDKVVSWVRSLDLDEYTTNGLIKLAEGYPYGSLPMFRKNFDVMLARVRQTRLQEEIKNSEKVEEVLKEEIVEETNLQVEQEVAEAIEPDMEIQEITDKEKREARRKPVVLEEVEPFKKEQNNDS